MANDLKTLVRFYGVSEPDYILEGFLKSLYKKGLIIRDNDIINVEIVYFNKIIDSSQPIIESFQELTKIFSGDPNNLLKIGIQLYNNGIQLKNILNDSTQRYLELGEGVFNKILRKKRLKNRENYYLKSHFYLGLIYKEISKATNRIEDYRKSISEFHSALIRKYSNDNIDYGQIYLSLAQMYLGLANLDNFINNLKTAENYYRKSKKFFRREKNLLYASIKLKIGILYLQYSKRSYTELNLTQLSQESPKKSRLKQRIKFFLKNLTNKNRMKNVVFFSKDLDTTRRDAERDVLIHDFYNIFSKLESAIISFFRVINLGGIEYWYIPMFPGKSSEGTNESISIESVIFPNHEKQGKYLRSSIDSLQDAYEVYNQNNNQQILAMIQYYISQCYFDLYLLGYNLENIKKSLISINQALLYYNRDDYPRKYFDLKFLRGECLYILAKYENKSENLNLSLNEYGVSLEICNPIESPIKYSTLVIKIATVNFILSRENNFENLRENVINPLIRLSEIIDRTILNSRYEELINLIVEYSRE